MPNWLHGIVVAFVGGAVAPLSQYVATGEIDITPMGLKKLALSSLASGILAVGLYFKTPPEKK